MRRERRWTSAGATPARELVRRRILRGNVTRNPNTLWVMLQLCETREYGEQPQRFPLFERDSKFGADVASIVKAMGSQPLRDASCSPWPNAGWAACGVTCWMLCCCSSAVRSAYPTIRHFPSPTPPPKQVVVPPITELAVLPVLVTGLPH